LSSAAQIAATPLMDDLIARTVLKRVPLSVHFDLTYRCNERCIHCYLDHQDYGELNTQECLHALRQLASAGAFFLTFSGGEIFLRKDLEEILAAARRLQFDISLKTNALLITLERAAMLAKYGVRRVQISIYSSEPGIHDAITKVPGSLHRSLASIPLLQERGIQVKLACPLMQENLSAYRGVIALAEKLGVPYVLDLTITPMMDGSHAPLQHRISSDALLPILQDSTLQSCGTKFNAENWDTAPALGSAVSSGIESSAYEDLPCSAGHNSCYISPYGDVYACVQLPMPAGNIRTQRFAEIWKSAPALERIRNVRESELPVCASCKIRNYCERCPGLAWMEGGDLHGPYERACSLAEQKAKVAGVANPVSAWHARISPVTMSPATHEQAQKLCGAN
jgi:radical SAM protein with 4Fe4S-binding SPASM domain